MILDDVDLDTNEVADEREWPHPPLEPVIEGDTMFRLGAFDCKGGVAAIVDGVATPGELSGGVSPEFTLGWGDVYTLSVIMGATLEEDAEGFACARWSSATASVPRSSCWPRRPTCPCAGASVDAARCESAPRAAPRTPASRTWARALLARCCR